MRKKRKLDDTTWSKTSEAKRNKRIKTSSHSARNPFGRFDDSNIKSMFYFNSNYNNNANIIPNKLSTINKGIDFYKKNYEFRGIGFYTNQSPKKIYTPENKTELTNKKKTIYGNLYTNFPEIDYTTIEKLSLDHPFFSSEAYSNIVKPEENIKIQSLLVTPEQLKKMQREKNNNLETRSQNKIMAVDGDAKKGSATAYVKETKLFDDELKWEYAHLISYEFGGKKFQTNDNLVITTTAANTEMIIMESAIKWLVNNKFPEGVNVRITANLIPGTQIGTYIKYQITAGDCTFCHTINAQNPNKPHLSEKDITLIMSKTLNMKNKENTEDNKNQIEDKISKKWTF
jgi:hypothetical protein